MRRPRLHVVALAHLDTQWRWTARDTARDYLPDTVGRNRRLFARYPSYVLSFEGAWRYRLLAEHHADLFAEVREQVEQGRWAPAGAAVEAFDCLLPSPESILHQIVLGRRYFRRRFGRDSRDLFLPDCFGFPATLPTLATHAGLIGFSTQKLRRGPLLRAAVEIPFAFGRWRGPDGSELLAALDPGEYSGRIEDDLSTSAEWIERFERLAAAGGGDRLLFYVGTGDRGGAPPETTIAELQAAIDAQGPIEVRHGPSESIYVETDADERAGLPTYQGELLLRLHGTGCYTAKAVLKRWNGICERLARDAEIAAAAARSVGGAIDPDRLVAAWTPLLAHQMHDDLTGTAIPAAYRLTLDDLGLAANRFAEVLVDAIASLGASLPGGSAEWLALSSHAAPAGWLAEVPLEPGDVPTRVVDAEGIERPVQRTTAAGGGNAALVPVAASGIEIQSLALAADSTDGAWPGLGDELVVAPGQLENARMSVRIDAAGRLASLFDKQLGRDLLAAPVELELLPDRSPKYPAWEIRYEDESAAPRMRAGAPAEIEIVEAGPLRATLRVLRRIGRASRIAEHWRLASFGEIDWLLCDVELDWRERSGLLKQRFPFLVEGGAACFDSGLGAVRRPLASADLYEVPAQHWAALDGELVTPVVLSDSRHGWDHPAAGVLRLTWIHAPAPGHKFRHQRTQDRARHHFRIAVAALSAGGVDRGEAARLADRFLQRPRLFRRIVAEGAFDPPQRRRFLSLVAPARLLTWKPADLEERGIVRLSNPASVPLSPELALGDGLTLGAVVDAMEETLALDSPAELRPSGLLAHRVEGESAPPAPKGASPLPVALPWRLRGFSRQGERLDPGFDGAGTCFPLERPNDDLLALPLPFDLCHLGRGEGDVYVPDGLPIDIPPGTRELWLLGASIDGDRRCVVHADDREIVLEVPDWRRPLLTESRWRRRWSGSWRHEPERFARLPVAFSVLHLHDAAGRDHVLARGTLFALAAEIGGACQVRFEPESRIRVVAALAAPGPQRPWRESSAP